MAESALMSKNASRPAARGPCYGAGLKDTSSIT